MFQQIGILKLKPLPGSPHLGNSSSFEALQEAGLAALKEYKHLIKQGATQILIENSGDAPFTHGKFAAEGFSAFSILAAALKDLSKAPLGVEIREHQPILSMALASTTGCDFIRVRQASSGQKLGRILRYRSKLRSAVRIFVEVIWREANQKQLSQSLRLVSEILKDRSADALVIRSIGSEKELPETSLQAIRELAQTAKIPLYLSGVFEMSQLKSLSRFCSGVILESPMKFRQRHRETTSEA